MSLFKRLFGKAVKESFREPEAYVEVARALYPALDEHLKKVEDILGNDKVSNVEALVPLKQSVDLLSGMVIALREEVRDQRFFSTDTDRRVQEIERVMGKRK